MKPLSLLVSVGLSLTLASVCLAQDKPVEAPAAPAADQSPAAGKPHTKTREEKRAEKWADRYGDKWLKEIKDKDAFKSKLGDAYWLQDIKGETICLCVIFHAGSTLFVDHTKSHSAIEDEYRDRWARALTRQGFTVQPDMEKLLEDPIVTASPVLPTRVVVEVALVDEGFNLSNGNYFAVSMHVNRIVSDIYLSDFLPAYKKEDFCPATEEALNKTIDTQIDKFVRDFYKARALESQNPAKNK